MRKRRCSKRVRYFWVGALCMLLQAGAFFVVGDACAAQSKWGVCVECHEQVVKAFDTTFHGKAWGAGAEQGGCASCHGEADSHAKDRSKKTIITFGKGAAQTSEEQNARCQKCHADSPELAFWAMGKHQANDVACVSCHKIHQAKNETSQTEVCLGCHTETRIQVNKQSHHPLKEGKIKCSSCHNPHGEFGNAMVRAASVNELCYKCHADKRGPYMWEHPPVEENCLNCHTVHGSNHKALLVKKTPALCQNCHLWTQHPSTPYAANASFANSRTRQFVGRDCLNCHNNVHGSNGPAELGLRYVR